MKDRKPEKPAEGIIRWGDYEDMKIYEVQCRCTDPDCSIEMIVAIEEEYPYDDITVEFGKEFRCHKFLDRIKNSLSMLFKGRYVGRSDTLLTKQSALNLAEVLKDSVKSMDECWEKRNQKKEEEKNNV